MQTLPQVPLGPHRISRLVAGGNPLRGNSHLSDELSCQMRDYYTTENVLKAWFEAEKCGVTAMQSRGDHIVMSWVDRYREQGGTMHWIVQTASEWKGGDVPDNIRTIARHGPVAIYHHGSRTDSLWKQGQIDRVHDDLKLIHDLGLVSGLGSHMPEVFEYAEERGWEVDFYMACAYNLSRVQRDSVLSGGKLGSETYDDADRARMMEVVRQTPKQCIFFKILAAGRKCATQETVREAFRWAFERLKPVDVVDVGFFQRDRNEIALDAAHVRAVTGWNGTTQTLVADAEEMTAERAPAGVGEAAT